MVAVGGTLGHARLCVRAFTAGTSRCRSEIRAQKGWLTRLLSEPSQLVESTERMFQAAVAALDPILRTKENHPFLRHRLGSAMNCAKGTLSKSHEEEKT